MKYIIFLFAAIIWTSCGDTSNTANKVAAAEKISDPGKYQLISQTPDTNRNLENPKIEVEVEGLPPGEYSLVGSFTGNFYRAATATANGNKLLFTRDEPLKPGLFYILFPDNKTTIQILLDEDQTMKIKTSMQDILANMQVEGNSDTQYFYEAAKFEEAKRADLREINEAIKAAKQGTDEFAQLVEKQKIMLDERKNYLEELFRKRPKSLFSSFKESGQNPDLNYLYRKDGSLDTMAYAYAYRKKFWENVNFDDDRLLYTPVIPNKLERFFTELMPQNPDTIKTYASQLVDRVLDNNEYYKYFANWITLKFEPTKTSLMDAEAVFVHMIKNYFTYERAFWSDSAEVYALQLRAHEMGQSLVGQKGPDVTAKDPNGNMRSISDLDADYIAVFMWNPDCDHCAEETPKLIDFYKRWKSKGFDVYSIAVNTEDDKWRSAIKKYNMPWTNVFDPTNRAIYAKYFVDNTPELYVLNPDRIIIGKNLKVFQLETVIERDRKERG